MILYNYDDVSGEFVGESIAKIDPRAKTPMITANATDKKVPDLVGKQTVFFVGDEWVVVEFVEPVIEPEPEKTQSEINRDLKMTGVLIEGVMCSATTQDSNGLLAANVWLSRGQSTRFEFENGNNLLLTPANQESFGAEWMRFRQSFWAST
jgi:hypothetical protein